MNRLTSHLAALATATAAFWPLPSGAAPLLFLSEGFFNLAALAGCFEGALDRFGTCACLDDAYAAANYPSAANGLGLVFTAGSGAGADAFDPTLAIIAGAGFPPQWRQWDRSLAAESTGSFASSHLDDAAGLDDVGLDGVGELTAVPEPANWLLIAGGAGVLAFARRRLPCR